MKENEQGGTSPASSCWRVYVVPPQIITTSPSATASVAKRPAPCMSESPNDSRGSSHVSDR